MPVFFHISTSFPLWTSEHLWQLLGMSQSYKFHIPEGHNHSESFSETLHWKACPSPSGSDLALCIWLFLTCSMNCLLGKPFEIKRVLNASVANVIVSVLLGKRFDYQDPQFLRLLSLIGENVKLIGSPRIVVMFFFLSFLISFCDLDPMRYTWLFERLYKGC